MKDWCLFSSNIRTHQNQRHLLSKYRPFYTVDEVKELNEISTFCCYSQLNVHSLDNKRIFAEVTNLILDSGLLVDIKFFEVKQETKSNIYNKKPKHDRFYFCNIQREKFYEEHLL